MPGEPGGGEVAVRARRKAAGVSEVSQAEKSQAMVFRARFHWLPA